MEVQVKRQVSSRYVDLWYTGLRLFKMKNCDFLSGNYSHLPFLSGFHLQALECGADTLLVDEGKPTMTNRSFPHSLRSNFSSECMKSNELISRYLRNQLHDSRRQNDAIG